LLQAVSLVAVKVDLMVGLTVVSLALQKVVDLVESMVEILVVMWGEKLVV
jgi:hypothetical protein